MNENLKKYPTHTCIFMTLDEFQSLIDTLTDGLRYIDYELDGISFYHTDKAEETETYWNQDLNETLSEYFDAPVTSVHADDSEPIGIWICYKQDTKVYVKSIEREIGTEYWQVTFPATMTKEQINQAIKMASRYAMSYDYDAYDFDNAEDMARAIEKYDEHVKDVFDVRATEDGQAAFTYYLETFYGCIVNTCIPECEYEYEW